MIVRSTNYTMTRQLHYMIHDETGVIRTTNLLLDLSPDLEIMHVEEIDDRPVRLNPPLFPVAGFEDCRLFAHQGSWWFSGTVRDRNQEGVCQIALVRLDGATTAQVQLLSDASTRRHEKNWMPVPGDDALRFVYAAFPTIIVRHEDAEMATPEFIQPAPLVARRCSGGSQVIPLDGGGLCLMHEAVNFEDGGRVYTHRWVWFDAGWTLARLSPPFRLHDRGVEFAAGVARRGDDLVISYGVWDREAWLATVRMAEILSLLAPPLDGDQIAAEMRATATLVAMSSGHDTQPTATVPATAARDASRAGEITPLSVPTPTIVATTLSGNSREIIGDALRSVGRLGRLVPGRRHRHHGRHRGDRAADRRGQAGRPPVPLAGRFRRRAQLRPRSRRRDRRRLGGDHRHGRAARLPAGSTSAGGAGHVGCRRFHVATTRAAPTARSASFASRRAGATSVPRTRHSSRTGRAAVRSRASSSMSWREVARGLPT